MKLNAGMAAVVTGAASGLGEATARMLAAQGVKVAIFDLQKERGEMVAADIGGGGYELAVSGMRSAPSSERVLDRDGESAGLSGPGTCAHRPGKTASSWPHRRIVGLAEVPIPANVA
jgi:NAD(P)-dependent dehydrogenase (short-subunit alcohol dehydrogenase family)